VKRGKEMNINVWFVMFSSFYNHFACCLEDKATLQYKCLFFIGKDWSSQRQIRFDLQVEKFCIRVWSIRKRRTPFL